MNRRKNSIKIVKTVQVGAFSPAASRERLLFSATSRLRRLQKPKEKERRADEQNQLRTPGAKDDQDRNREKNPARKAFELRPGEPKEEHHHAHAVQFEETRVAGSAVLNEPVNDENRHSDRDPADFFAQRRTIFRILRILRFLRHRTAPFDGNDSNGRLFRSAATNGSASRRTVKIDATGASVRNETDFRKDDS